MSFINKALEKAKSLHHQKGKPTPSPSQAPPQAPLPDLDEITGFAETPGEIHYTYTRTVAVDMDRLRRNRLIVAGSDENLGEAYKLLRTHILHGTKRGRPEYPDGYRSPAQRRENPDNHQFSHMLFPRKSARRCCWWMATCAIRQFTATLIFPLDRGLSII